MKCKKNCQCGLCCELNVMIKNSGDHAGGGGGGGQKSQNRFDKINKKLCKIKTKPSDSAICDSNFILRNRRNEIHEPKFYDENNKEIHKRPDPLKPLKSKVIEDHSNHRVVIYFGDTLTRSVSTQNLSSTPIQKLSTPSGSKLSLNENLRTELEKCFKDKKMLKPAPPPPVLPVSSAQQTNNQPIKNNNPIRPPRNVSNGDKINNNINKNNHNGNSSANNSDEQDSKEIVKQLNHKTADRDDSNSNEKICIDNTINNTSNNNNKKDKVDSGIVVNNNAHSSSSNNNNNNSNKPGSDKFSNDKLPSYIESIVNGVINIRIEENFIEATKLVQTIENDNSSDDLFNNSNDSNDYNNINDFDWGFVQEWRSRPSGVVHARTDFPTSPNYTNSIATATTTIVTPPSTKPLSPQQNNQSTQVNTNSNSSNHINSNSNHQIQKQIASSTQQQLQMQQAASSGRIQSPAVATIAPKISREMAFRPTELTTPTTTSLSTVSANPNTGSSGSNSSASQIINWSLINGGSNVNISRKADADLGFMDNDEPVMMKSTSNKHHQMQQVLNMIPERERIITTDLPPMTSIAISKPVKDISTPATVALNSSGSNSSSANSSMQSAKLQTTGSPIKLSSNSNIIENSIPMMANPLTKPISAGGHLQQGVPQSNKLSSSGNNSSHSNHHDKGNLIYQSQAESDNFGHHKGTINMRTHHHAGTHHDLSRIRASQDYHSSSDENRSSGHASMSDNGHRSSSPGGNHTNGVHRNTGLLGPLPEDRLAAGVTNRSSRSRVSTNHSRSRHRIAPAKAPWGGGGLEDIKLAIQQLTIRSQTSTSTYSSLSAGSESSEPVRRLGRYSSLETVNTNITNADEFVWVDSHNRLVELQHLPWTQHCILRVIRARRCREHAERISMEAIPRIGYLLQRALVRIAREVQRLSGCLGLCSKHEVAGAFKIVLCPALADSCIKACLRAAAMFAVPGDSALRQSKSSRAGLQLPVGRFHRWMTDARLGRFVHEYAAVYLCAGLENLLEEILLQCLARDSTSNLSATGLEHAIASSGDLWGLLQPFAHLNAGRIATGALTMPRWASQSSIGSSSDNSNHNSSNGNNQSSSLEPCLLTTCVGSILELRELVGKAQKKCQNMSLSFGGLKALFYFMRCSQLEHNEGGVNGNCNTVQELCYERAYVVLPPLVEWLRVASAHCEYRHGMLIDKDDIMQAARLLLPGVDCPPRPYLCDEDLPCKKSTTMMPSPGGQMNSPTPHIPSSLAADDANECGRRACLILAFRMMLSGRSELLHQAVALLPPASKYDALNHQGLTALMIAAIRNDEMVMQTLLDAGVDPNIEVPNISHQQCTAIHPETQHWTAMTFAACRGNYQAVRLLLERGGHVEGGARLSEDTCTLTPLQVASGSGSIEIVSLLLAHGAHAFLSTQQKDSLCYSGSAQRGCFSAISVAAAHGQRPSLRKLLSHPLSPGSREVLSLEEMLAESDSTTRGGANERQNETPPTLNKTQIKSLQEAMYHSAENNYLDITVELRALGVPWTLHCWMHALAAAHELRLDAVIDQLLQDFLHVCPDDYSTQFVSECLPLLFNIFRYSKKEGTTLLLADIFATCFGWEPIKPIIENVNQPVNGSRIDPKFVNNPELSDVTFRVEGKIFYGHKIVLVTASPRFQNMLSSKLTDGTTPTVQINDIRYNIFQLVMQYLYSGGCNSLDVSSSEVLELMAAASFFQLEGLLRYTEARCSEMIDIDNVVAMYIHAKVYNASKLMEYCQAFLLQNMVALLTYDDSVKRLLFAKKIPNHDVLSGLLTTLQARIKMRRHLQNPANIKRPATVLSSRIS